MLTPGDFFGSSLSLARWMSYSVKPVPRCPQRRDNAMRSASRIAVFPALFGPTKTVVSLRSTARCRIERKLRISIRLTRIRFGPRFPCSALLGAHDLKGGAHRSARHSAPLCACVSPSFYLASLNSDTKFGERLQYEEPAFSPITLAPSIKSAMLGGLLPPEAIVPEPERARAADPSKRTKPGAARG